LCKEGATTFARKERRLTGLRCPLLSRREQEGDGSPGLDGLLECTELRVILGVNGVVGEEWWSGGRADEVALSLQQQQQQQQ
jgi:hypothetical protein